MKYKDFKALERAYSAPFSQGKYKEALEILNVGMKTLTEEEVQKNLFEVMFDRAQIKSLSGMYDECFEDLEYLIQRGFICPLYWSRFSEPFGEEEKYIKLREANDRLREKEQERSRMKWDVSLPRDFREGKKYPLFINLHGDEDNASFHKEF